MKQIKQVDKNNFLKKLSTGSYNNLVQPLSHLDMKQYLTPNKRRWAHSYSSL